MQERVKTSPKVLAITVACIALALAALASTAVSYTHLTLPTKA